MSRIPEKWRDASPVKAAELLIASNPAMLQHRKDGKRAATQVGEQTLRQIRWAAVLKTRLEVANTRWSPLSKDRRNAPAL